MKYKANIKLPIILFHDTGELGNRLVTYAHLMSLSIERQVKLVNLCFWRYRPHLKWKSSLIERPWLANKYTENNIYPKSHAEDCRICGYSLGRLYHKRTAIGRERFTHKSLILQRLIGYLFRFVLQFQLLRYFVRKVYHVIDAESDGHRFSVLLPKGLENVELIDGERVNRYSSIIRERLAFRPHYVDAARQFVRTCRRNQLAAAKIVGAHVRRGDYRNYRGGKFFLDDAAYVNVIQQIRTSYNDELQIIIASNEDVVALEQRLGSSAIAAPRDSIIALCVLGETELLIGAPSTFSGWASFMSERPILFFSQETDDLDFLISKASAWTPRWY